MADLKNLKKRKTKAELESEQLGQALIDVIGFMMKVNIFLVKNKDSFNLPKDSAVATGFAGMLEGFNELVELYVPDPAAWQYALENNENKSVSIVKSEPQSERPKAD